MYYLIYPTIADIDQSVGNDFISESINRCNSPVNDAPASPLAALVPNVERVSVFAAPVVVAVHITPLPATSTLDQAEGIPPEKSSV